MKSLFFALLCSAALTSAASAQTIAPIATPTSTSTERHEPAGARVVYFTNSGESYSRSAYANKYELRRMRATSFITGAEAREIRGRKRREKRQENAYLKAQAARDNYAPEAARLKAERREKRRV